MKIARTGDGLILQLGRRERQLLLDLLKLYPCIPATHQLQRSAGLSKSSQGLLDEALAEQRVETKMQLEQFLAEPDRFQTTETGWRLSLSATEVEWLLQVLNDVRVGSWILLGSPDEKMHLKLLNENTAPHFWSMEMAGQFQMELLHAIHS